jgi:hypothetical protein
MSCPRGCCDDYRTHIRGISIGSFPTQTTYTERKWDKDMPAYKRLVESGLQPPKIDGCYVIEREATHAKEIELGRKLDPLTQKVLDDSV